MKLTRSQILTKYELNRETFSYIHSLGFLKHDFVNEKGRRVINITKKDGFILSCAKNTLSSFGYGLSNKGKIRGVHPPPFYRFLVLRFLTTPVDEIYEEIFHMGLLRSRAKWPIKELTAIYNRFLDRLPTSLRKIISKHKEPNKAQKEEFTTFLRVMSIRDFYENPYSVEVTEYFLKTRVVSETFMSTRSSSEDVAKAITEYMGETVGTTLVSAYRTLFYSIHDMSEVDKEAYFTVIHPSEKANKKSALTMTMPEYGMAKGMTETSVETMLRKLRDKTQREIFDLMGLKTKEGKAMLRAALDRFLKIDDKLNAMGGGDESDANSFFNGFKTLAADQSGIVKIDEARLGASTSSG